VIKSLDELLSLLKNNPRLGLAKAITLVESTLPEHQQLTTALMRHIEQHQKNLKTRRITISGSPGVGKSTLIEKLGLMMIQDGHRVAVLSIDPSSPIAGGSILGDKTRMSELANHPQAFVRPSPSLGSLGGVNPATFESMLCCEFAGFDTVIIETVGVGQSEFAGAYMSDLFIPLHLPNSGDELQGIKKGILELADMIFITKVEEENRLSAQMAKADLTSALSLHRHGAIPIVLTSSHKTAGLDDARAAIETYFDNGAENLVLRRQQQKDAWIDRLLQQKVMSNILQNPEFKTRCSEAKSRVAAGHQSTMDAVDQIAKFQIHWP
jgi:LAO/AO transport system kinase